MAQLGMARFWKVELPGESSEFASHLALQRPRLLLWWADFGLVWTSHALPGLGRGKVARRDCEVAAASASSPAQVEHAENLSLALVRATICWALDCFRVGTPAPLSSRAPR